MGNPQHLEWLLEGVDAWNARRAREDFVPDFVGVDIQRAFEEAGQLIKIGRIPLNGVNLKEADLESTNLVRADLRAANLANAYLVRANLREVDLLQAELRETALVGANFFGTSLRDTNLKGSDIRTFFSQLSKSTFGPPEYTDLSNTESLSQEQLNSMNGDTGVMLPEGLLHPAHWPKPQPPNPEPVREKKTPFVFLSYAAKDRDLIQSLHGLLTSQGLPLWWDQDIPPGDGWRDRLQEQLGSAAGVVTFWTEASVASDAVREEASTAQRAGKLIHVRLDDAPLPFGYAETQYQDLRDWDGTHSDPRFQRLVQALKDKLDPPSREVLEARLSAGAPITAKVIGRKIGFADTPVNTAPEVENSEDLAARLIGLGQTLTRVQSVIADRDAYQLPEDLHRRLAGITGILGETPLTWYAVEDARDALAGCITYHDGRAAWNDGVVQDLDRLLTRISQLQPLMQPKQVPMGEPGAKPLQPDAVVREADVPELGETVEEVTDLLSPAEVDEVFTLEAASLMRRDLEDLQDAIEPAFGDAAVTHRFARLRRGVRALVYTIGAFVTAISGGVMVNLLTAPEAAVTLAARLRPILDKLLGYFH